MAAHSHSISRWIRLWCLHLEPWNTAVAAAYLYIKRIATFATHCFISFYFIPKQKYWQYWYSTVFIPPWQLRQLAEQVERIQPLFESCESRLLLHTWTVRESTSKDQAALPVQNKEHLSSICQHLPVGILVTTHMRNAMRKKSYFELLWDKAKWQSAGSAL